MWATKGNLLGNRWSKPYPGFQRLFMRGFRFRSRQVLTKTCWPVADEAPRRTREKTFGTQGIEALSQSQRSQSLWLLVTWQIYKLCCQWNVLRREQYWHTAVMWTGHVNSCKEKKKNCNISLIFIVGAIWIEMAVLNVLKYMIKTSLVQQLSKVCNWMAVM